MTTILNALFGWAWIVMLAVLGVVVIVASLWQDEIRHADEILDRDREWECDFSETVLHNNSQGGATINSRHPSPKSFGRN